MENKVELSEAIKLVNVEIEKNRKLLEDEAKSEGSPIMVEGETYTGYPVQTMVDPGKVIPICLNYDFPTYKVLEEDFPQGMWDDLAQLLGLEHVYAIDL